MSKQVWISWVEFPLQAEARTLQLALLIQALTSPAFAGPRPFTGAFSMPILLGIIPAAVSSTRITQDETQLKTLPDRPRVRPKTSFAHSFS
jgi:hypothetical protein